LLACFADHLDQAFHGILPVAFLRPKPFGMDYQNAVFGYFFSRQSNQTLAHILRQRGRVFDIKPKLNGRGYLVDVLTPRA
jgi:hypothetical protein